MEAPSSNIVYMENSVGDDLGPAMNCAVFNDLLEFQMKNNPALAGKTRRDIAEACYMSESTLKNLCNGKNDNPRIGTLKRILRYIGGGSVDRIIGFAPPRDFAKEEAQYDASLVEALQIRLDEKRERIGELTAQLTASEAELARLRKLVLEKGEALSAALAKAESADNNRDDLVLVRSTLYNERAEYKRLRVALVIACAVAVIAMGLAIYFLWEALHPYAGNFRV